MDYNFIRRCLIRHADMIGRDHYSPMVVNAVIRSIERGTEHHLKNYVLTQLNSRKSHTVELRRKELLVEFVKSYGGVHLLSKVTGIGDSNIRDWLSGRYNISDESWLKLLNSFDKVKKCHEEKIQRKANRQAKST